MKTRISLLTILSVMLICLSGCSNKKEFEEFSFTYSMESVDNYKMVITFDSDQNYKLEEYNYFFDNAANKRDPKISEGKLTDKEFEEIQKLLSKSKLFEMEDSYGFDKEYNRDLGDIMYQISFSTKDKDKFISIRTTENQQFSSGFISLIGYINTFINSHKKEVAN